MVPLRVVAFYSSTCQDCYKAKKALAAVRKRWGNRVRVEHRDMKDVKVFVQMFAYDEHYAAEAQAPPKVFVGEQYLEGYPAIAKRLEAVVAKELDKGTVTFDPKAGAVVAEGSQKARLDVVSVVWHRCHSLMALGHWEGCALAGALRKANFLR